MLDWIYPQIIESIESPVNGKIKVKKFAGKFQVWVGGFQQSGPLIEELWRKYLKNISFVTYCEILILGLGCGSAIKPLLEKYPKSDITGIEIDKEIIKIGKKYFDLEKTKNLKIINVDAVRFCKNTKNKYDLVLIDMYKGNLPEKMKIDISKLLNPGGKGIINVLSGLKNTAVYLP